MNQKFPKQILINNSGLGCWLTLLLVGLLLGSVGLGWLVNGFLIVLGILFILPAIGVLVARWWIKQSIVVDACPVCQYELTGFSGSQSQCPSCGEILEVKDRKFKRYTPPGTIDVDARDVSVQKLE